MSLERLCAAIRNIPDFPQPGIQFKDITPLLADPALFAEAVELLAARHRSAGIAKVCAIDARGFIFGAAVARALNAGLVPIRKKGKLPYRTIEASYALEYGTATLAMHADALGRGERVLLVDDLLATGGTAAAAAALIGQLGAELVELEFLIELSFLQGRAKLAPHPVYAPIVF